MVGAATVALAELRIHLPDPRTTVTVRQGIAGIAAVLGAYVTPPWCTLGDKPSLVCGMVAAVFGPIVEIVLVKIGVFVAMAW